MIVVQIWNILYVWTYCCLYIVLQWTMEFLKAFEEAKKFGLTKEEFMHIWEIEVSRKQTEKENERLLQMNNDQVSVK